MFLKKKEKYDILLNFPFFYEKQKYRRIVRPEERLKVDVL